MIGFIEIKSALGACESLVVGGFVHVGQWKVQCLHLICHAQARMSAREARVDCDRSFKVMPSLQAAVAHQKDEALAAKPVIIDFQAIW
jgi:hypothetical protein